MRIQFVRFMASFAIVKTILRYGDFDDAGGIEREERGVETRGSDEIAQGGHLHLLSRPVHQSEFSDDLKEKFRALLQHTIDARRWCVTEATIHYTVLTLQQASPP